MSTPTPFAPRGRGDEAGTALIAALFFAVTILAYSVSLISSGVAVHNQKRYMIAGERALDAAEAGVHHLLAAVNGGQDQATFIADGLRGVLQGDADSDRATRYEVRVMPAGSDAADNDLDGLVDEADEADMLEVISTGWADNVNRTVRVTMLARYRTPDIPSAIYVADTGASLSLKGNAFLISGFEVDSNGKLLLGEDPSPAIGVPGDPTPIKNKISGKAGDNVRGEGGTPSVGEVDIIDFEPLIEDAIRSADVKLTGAQKGPETEGAWGTLESPKILYGEGDLHFSGNGKGAGVLVVDGDLKISGGFEWVGVIIVRGKLTLTGGGGGKRLIGGLVVERKFTANSNSSGPVATVDPVAAASSVTSLRAELLAVIAGAEQESDVKTLIRAVEQMDAALDRLTIEPADLQGAGVELGKAYNSLVQAIENEEIGSIKGKEIAGQIKVLSKELKDGTTMTNDGSLTTTGTVDILYSPRSVNRVGRFFSSLTILNWREGPTPHYGAAP